jgi:hypothetical protein
LFISTIRSTALAMLILLAPMGALAQTSPSSAAATDKQLLKPAELDQLVAPIALYPDPLLSEVLMASAYPLEVVQAARWLQANKDLKGDQLKAAVDKQSWDESIKSLVATPSVLEMLNEKLDWTQKLGDAVVAQQTDVMDAIQRLRTKAQANNKLSSTNEQRASVNQVEGRQVIAIEPTDPNTITVPYYDPGVVYGDWPYPEYPPYYFPTPSYIAAGVIATGIAFGTAYALGRWARGGNYWGGGVNWGNRNLIVNRPANQNINVGNKWQPRVEHRQVAGGRAGRQQQLNFRGSGGQQVIKPGGGGAKLTDRNRPAHRQGTAERHRPSSGNRPVQGAERGRHHAAVRQHRPAVRQHAPARVGNLQAHRGRASVGGGGVHHGGGGIHRGGGGGVRGGGRGGGRRSDFRLKHDIVLLGYLDNGLGYYRFSYNGSDKLYVGVMAQEVLQVIPQAVARGPDGYLIVHYERLGLKFKSYDQWIKSGAQLPIIALIQR